MSEVTRVEEIYLAAVERTDPVERAAYLDAACGSDPDLRHRVLQLLSAHPKVGGFLEATHAYSPSPDAQRIAEGTMIGDRYKLLERIGEGGMGEVWMADQTEPVRRRVAVKLIKAGMDSRNVLNRFTAERQALAVMDHPNIAKVLDGGLHDGRPYFVMELVKGVPITEFCDARKLTPRERLELFVPVCQAIQHAHQKGVIHRDIKPSNVLVELYDDRPVPKVIDFGVAKAIGQPLTEGTLFTGFGTLVGTPAYMAPEQATFNALDVDTRADVYALGILLYELLAGSPPVEADRLKKAALEEVLRLVREEEPPRPSQRLSTSQAKASIAAVRGGEPNKLSALLRGELDWIVMKALEKDRSRRYDSATALAKDVQRYLIGSAVEACPPTVGYRLRKLYQRNKSTARIAAAFAFMIVCGLIVLGYSWQQRVVRRTAMERAATDAIDQAMLLRGQAKAAPVGEMARWAEAIAAAKQAEAVLNAGEPSDALRQRVSELLRSLDAEEAEARRTADQSQREKRLFQRIEAIRVEFVEADELNFYGSDKKVIADADSAYAAAFRKFGLEVDHVDPGEAAKLIRTCSRPLELAWAIDAWAMNRICLAISKKPNARFSEWDPGAVQKAQRLMDLAGRVDPDPWRCAMRANTGQSEYLAIINPQRTGSNSGARRYGYAKIVDLLENDKELSQQPARALYVISLMIEHSWHNEQAKSRRDQQLPVTKALRKRAWQLSPNDFQIAWFISTECRDESEQRAFALAAAAAAPESKFARELNLAEPETFDGSPLLSKVEQVAKGAKAPDWKFPHVTIESPTGAKVFIGPTRFEPLSEIERDKRGEVVAQLKWLIRLQPANIEIRKQLATALVRLGRFEEALAACRELTARDAKQHAADVIAYQLYGMGRLEQAKELIEDRFRVAPNRFEDGLFATLGTIYTEQGQRTKAFEAFRDAYLRKWKDESGHLITRTVSSWDEPMKASGTPEQVIAAYREWYSQSEHLPATQAGLAADLAEYLLAVGRTEEAIASYQQAITQKTGGRYRYELSRLLVKFKRHDEALKLYRDAIIKKEDDIDLREDLVSLLFELQREPEALAELKVIADLLRQRLAKEPASTVHKGNLASALWALGQRDEARKLYRDCIASSTRIAILNSFAMEMAQVLEPKDRDGELALEAAIKLCELTSYGTANYLDTLATAYAAKGDFASAVKWQQKAIEVCTVETTRQQLEANLKVFQAGKALPPDTKPRRRPWITP